MRCEERPSAKSPLCSEPSASAAESPASRYHFHDGWRLRWIEATTVSRMKVVTGPWGRASCVKAACRRLVAANAAASSDQPGARKNRASQ